jgi:opacity protein-like surface antigen
MGSLKRLALAGVAVVTIIPAAGAADLPPIIQQAPPPPAEYGGWYLRGDIGFSTERAGNFHEDGLVPPPTSVQNTAGAFETGGIYRLGVGYQFNSWLRADVTGEYRTPATWSSFDITNSGGTLIPEHVELVKSEFVALANVYADLGTWWCITPFVGAGAGFAGIKLSNFQETAPFGFNPNVNPNPNPIMANNFAPEATQWNFAWALHAGVAYKVTPNFSVELAYRYLNLGSAQSGAIVGFLNNPQGTVFHIDNISSQDVTLGVRWLLQPEEAPPAYPLVRKG